MAPLAHFRYRPATTPTHASTSSASRQPTPNPAPKIQFRHGCRPAIEPLRDWLVQPSPSGARPATTPSTPTTAATPIPANPGPHQHQQQAQPTMSDTESICFNKLSYRFPEAFRYLLRELRIKAGHPLPEDLTPEEEAKDANGERQPASQPRTPGERSE